MDNTPFILAGTEIMPGTKTILTFPAPNINMQVKIDIPVHVFHGKKAGPRLFIMGTIHGDEVNSIEIMRRVYQHIRLKQVCGTIIMVPVTNVHGLILQSRYLSDRRDLNRSFPGSKKGTLAARFAYGIMKHVVSHCQYGIDLHTGGYGRINMPQLRVDFRVPGAKKFAQAFNVPVILESQPRPGSLRQAAGELGIPVLVYEGGEALRFNELCIRGGVRGIMHVLHYLEILKSSSISSIEKSKSIITNTSRWLRAPVSGLVQPMGDVIARSVKKNDVLAVVHDPFLIKPSVELIAPFEGIVIGQALKAVSTEGDALYHIASFKKIKGVKAFIDEYRDEITTQEG